MKKLIFALLVAAVSEAAQAQDPVGNWRVISHIGSYGGETFDSHKALLTQRPCAAKIVYRITADGNYRLDASASGCDASYTDIQQRLYAKTKWKLEGEYLLTSATNFAVSQRYQVRFSGDEMSWKHDSGDVIVYQRLP
jgi:hypothetical protein